eukprot:1195269-Prymnesium_polylepis.2
MTCLNIGDACGAGPSLVGPAPYLGADPILPSPCLDIWRTKKCFRKLRKNKCHKKRVAARCYRSCSGCTSTAETVTALGR